MDETTEEILNTEGDSPEVLELDNTVIAYGDEVKVLGQEGSLVKVGGYLVRFTTPDDPDMTRDYFDSKTDYAMEFPGKSIAWFNHRMGVQTKDGRRAALKRRLRDAALTMDDVGVFMAGVLDEADEYEKFLLSQARAGKLGLSSGTAGHLVERTPQKNGTNHIDLWPLGLDASYTHAPAESRNRVVPLKSILPLEVEAEDAANVAETEPVTTNQPTPPLAGKGITMENEELIKLLDERDAAKAKTAEEQAKRDADLKAAQDAGYQKALDEIKHVKRGGYTYHKITEPGFKDDEVKSFLHWIATGDEVPYKAAMQEGNDAEGGFYVPEQWEQTIVAKRAESSVSAQIGVAKFNATSDIVRVPVEGTEATKFVVTPEEGSADENEPTAAQVSITVHKLTKLIKISNEMEADAVSGFGSYLAGVWGRSMAAADNYYHIATGTGGGEPQSMAVGGALLATSAAATAITAAEFITALFSYPDQYADGAVLIMPRDVLGYLRGLLVATPYAFIPANDPAVGSGNAKINGTIFGFPVYCTSALTGLTTAAPVATTKIS